MRGCLCLDLALEVCCIYTLYERLVVSTPCMGGCCVYTMYESLIVSTPCMRGLLRPYPALEVGCVYTVY